MFNQKRFMLGLAVLALPSVLWAADAAAAVSAQDPLSVTVRYYDLKLNSSQGVTDLYQRIRGAASEFAGRLRAGSHSSGRWHEMTALPTPLRTRCARCTATP